MIPDRLVDLNRLCALPDHRIDLSFLKDSAGISCQYVKADTILFNPRLQRVQAQRTNLQKRRHGEFYLLVFQCTQAVDKTFEQKTTYNQVNLTLQFRKERQDKHRAGSDFALYGDNTALPINDRLSKG